MRLKPLISLCFLINLYSLNSLDAQNNPPNFIVIVADDQGWNGTSVAMLKENLLSKSDFYETPNLELLAKEGMCFSNAYAAAPVCAPSRYSIQTGQTPARLQMIRVGMSTSHINHEQLQTIPKTLKSINSNYVTAHFGKWGMDSHPSVFGYDTSDGATKNKDGIFTNKPDQWVEKTSNDPKKIFSITERAANFIETAKEQPFYIQISHYAIHANLIATSNSIEKYKNKSPGRTHNNIGLAAMTEDLDKSIGILIKTLKANKLFDNTYIIYTSDNGSVPIIRPRRKYPKSYNYPLQRGKWDAMEGGIRVPLIVYGPKVKKGTYSDVPVSSVDFLPTIMHLAGKKDKQSEFKDGGSFKHLLFKNNKKPVKRKTDGLIFHVPYKNGIALNRPHSAIIKNGYKLITFHDNNERALFEMGSDISESNNLVKSHRKEVEILSTILNNYLSQVKAPKWKTGITWKNQSLKTINSFH